MKAAAGAGIEDPCLSPSPNKGASEASASEDNSDRVSDSVFPKDAGEGRTAGRASTLYQACAGNEAVMLQNILDRGVTREEVVEVDVNGRNGLMVAAYRGFVDIVSGLHSCPYLDINHQDNEGNTALMIAAQAGHITILNYILNFFAGTDVELRDSRGFTALMKAAIQGQSDCVTALVMAGANQDTVDASRWRCARQWALKTSRTDTLQTLRRLSVRPRAEQLCDSYVPEWTDLRHLAARAASAQSRGECFLQRLRSVFTFSCPGGPQDDGALDHMVRITTSARSLFVITGCRPLWPAGPLEEGTPCVGAIEWARHGMAREPEGSFVQSGKGPTSSFSLSAISMATSMLTSCCSQRRGSALSVASGRVRGFVPRSTARRCGVLPFPGDCVPQIRVTKPGEPAPKKEKMTKKTKGRLELPEWKYKEAKQEKKKDKKEEAGEEEQHDTEKSEKYSKK